MRSAPGFCGLVCIFPDNLEEFNCVRFVVQKAELLLDFVVCATDRGASVFLDPVFVREVAAFVSVFGSDCRDGLVLGDEHICGGKTGNERNGIWNAVVKMAYKKDSGEAR